MKNLMVIIVSVLMIFSFTPFHISAEENKFTYFAIAFRDASCFPFTGIINDCNISTNFTFEVYACLFQDNCFIKYVNASWCVINNGTNASINATYGKSVRFNSGEFNGTVILKASCNGTYDTVKFTVNSSLFSYFMRRWTAIAVPPWKEKCDLERLFKMIYCCRAIWAWDAFTQHFIFYTPGAPVPDFNASGKGVFVLTLYSSILSLPSDRPGEPVPEFFPISLYVGWNLLPWFRKETSAESIFTNITECIILLSWDAEKGDFNLYIPGCPDAFTLRKGDAFFAAVSQESTWYA